MRIYQETGLLVVTFFGQRTAKPKSPTMRTATVLAGLFRSAAASDVHADSDILFGFMPDWPRW